MTKKEILNIINQVVKELKMTQDKNDEFSWSEPIEDKYFQKKGIENVRGFGVYGKKLEIENVQGFGVYDKKLEIENRFCLYIELENSNKNNNTNKSLTVLLMNPSNTFPKNIAKQKKCKPGFDQTIRNLIEFLIKIVNQKNANKKYNQVVVLNTFPYIESNSNEANKNCKNNELNEIFINEEFINKEFIKEIINKSKEVLVAYGSCVKKELHKECLKLLKDRNDLTLYTYAKNLTKNKNRPRHLSPRSYNRVKDEDKGLFKLEIVEDKYQIQAP